MVSAIGMSISVYIGNKKYLLFISQKSLSSLKVRKNGQQKRASCFATLLQNELNGDVAPEFYHPHQTGLATNQVVNRFEREW